MRKWKVQLVREIILVSRKKPLANVKTQKTASIKSSSTPQQANTVWNEALQNQSEARPAEVYRHRLINIPKYCQSSQESACRAVHEHRTDDEIEYMISPSAAQLPDIILDQLVGSIALQVHDKVSQIKVTLQPESLGEVFVKIKMQEGRYKQISTLLFHRQSYPGSKPWTAS